MSDIITKYQNREITINKACKDYELTKSSLTQTVANQVYDFLQLELEKIHEEIAQYSNHQDHTSVRDPELGYPYFEEGGIVTYITRRT